MQVQIIESNRSGKIALHDGHSYNQKQSTINCIHWRCTKNYKLKCPAILKTKNETVTETKGFHNHECEPGECKAKEVVNQIKRIARYSTPTVAIANEMYEVSDDYAVQLAMPRKDNLLRAVSRKRQKAICLQIPAPTDRHFDVPNEFAPFLLQGMIELLSEKTNPNPGKILADFENKSKSLQVCCPSEMLIASDFFLMMFRNIIFKFGTYGSLSNMTFGSYVTLSY